MQYSEINGDVLDLKDISGPTYICHQVNCKGAFGAGLARQIRDKFPAAYEDYKANYRHKKLGDYLVTEVARNVYIVHLFGQRDYGTEGTFTDYNALSTAFHYLFCDYEQAVIRVPYGIGCGLAGGSWNRVKQIILDEAGYSGFEGYLQIWKLAGDENAS